MAEPLDGWPLAPLGLDLPIEERMRDLQITPWFACFASAYERSLPAKGHYRVIEARAVFKGERRFQPRPGLGRDESPR